MLGICELFLELGFLGEDFHADSPLSESRGDRQDVPHLPGSHIGEQQGRGRSEPFREFSKRKEHVIYAVCSERDADSGDSWKSEYACQVIITSASTDTSDRIIKGFDLEYRPGVIIQAAGKGEVDLNL